MPADCDIKFQSSDFRTRLVVTRDPGHALTHADPVLLLGSCFSDEMGERLRRRWFASVSNPFGALYNPLSMARALRLSLGTYEPCDSDFVCDQSGIWHSWMLHSRFSSADRTEVENALAGAFAASSGILKAPGRLWLMVTFGNAYCYVLRSSGEVVANCHKFPQSRFELRRLSVDDITAEWLPLLRRLRELRPDMRVVFTVSPVRYLSYGPAGNSFGKATLMLAVERLCSEPGTSYFPAAELLVDDLRDYRYYAADMVHPSDVAADYIFGAFMRRYCDEDTIKTADDFLRLETAAGHRPLVNDAAAARIRVERLTAAVNKITVGRPDLSSRRDDFLRRIHNEI